MTSLFVFGTLRDSELLEIVVGHPVKTTAAVLEDHRVLGVVDQDFPICVPHTGGRAEGLLIHDLSDSDMERLDFYETGFGYSRGQYGISVADRVEQAQMYVPEGGVLVPSEADWSLSNWQAEHGALTRAVSREAMKLLGQIPSSELPSRWPVIAARAQARLAAQMRPAPTRAGLPSLANLEVDRIVVPYDGFFRLEEHHIRYPHFAGGVSKTVSRVAFVATDAVTVLPYDPVRDKVLLVDQFRIGAYARGDRQPWTLEPIAGRVDGGETWEDTAHREAWEEAGLRLQSLEFLGSYYPSPGAHTEYLASYIGVCEIPDGQAGLFGVAEEAEDICTRVFAFSDLMDMTQDGRIQNGPLLISAFWLASQRARLRSGVQGLAPRSSGA